MSPRNRLPVARAPWDGDCETARTNIGHNVNITGAVQNRVVQAVDGT
jgi:hypothetical protein